MQNSAIALGEYRTHDTRMAHRFHPGTDGDDGDVPTTLAPRQGPRANAHRDKISRKGVTPHSDKTYAIVNWDRKNE